MSTNSPIRPTHGSSELQIILNWNAVKNDGQYHTMWEHGNIAIKGYSGEFNNISTNVFVNGKNYYASYNPFDAIDYAKSCIQSPLFSTNPNKSL